MILSALLPALLAASGPAAAAPVTYHCEGEANIYNDGRDQAAWYSMRRPWTARLTVDRQANTWRLVEAAGARHVASPGALHGMDATGRPQTRDLPLTSDRRGSSLRSSNGEELGRFAPASGRLTLPDWMARPGVSARCRPVGR